MGLSPFRTSGSSYDRVKIEEVQVPNPFNPDPKNFLIERVEYEGMAEYIVVEVSYPNCKNYEGRKILVFNSLTLSELLNLDILDPHFSSEKPELSPIARFVPTDLGWDMAVQFAKDCAWRVQWAKDRAWRDV